MSLPDEHRAHRLIFAVHGEQAFFVEQVAHRRVDVLEVVHEVLAQRVPRRASSACRSIHASSSLFRQLRMENPAGMGLSRARFSVGHIINRSRSGIGFHALPHFVIFLKNIIRASTPVRNGPGALAREKGWR